MRGGGGEVGTELDKEGAQAGGVEGCYACAVWEWGGLGGDAGRSSGGGTDLWSLASLICCRTWATR